MGSHDKLISVIVPVYNVENYLEKCVRSLQKQTYKNLEVFLIDDGSMDRSGIMCDKFASEDPRIHVVHKTNGGPSSARNEGLHLLIAMIGSSRNCMRRYYIFQKNMVLQ